MPDSTCAAHCRDAGSLPLPRMTASPRPGADCLSTLSVLDTSGILPREIISLIFISSFLYMVLFSLVYCSRGLAQIAAHLLLPCLGGCCSALGTSLRLLPHLVRRVPRRPSRLLLRGVALSATPAATIATSQAQSFPGPGCPVHMFSLSPPGHFS